MLPSAEMKQHDTLPCRCGGTIRVTPTESKYEFEERCDRCPHEAWVSWAHYKEPPVYVRHLQQKGLFDAELVTFARD